MDSFEIYKEQVDGLLDLIECCDADCVDIRSIQTAAEMCCNLLDDINDFYQDEKAKYENALDEIKHLREMVERECGGYQE